MRQREDAMEGVSRYALAVPQCIPVFETFHACLGPCPESLDSTKQLKIPSVQSSRSPNRGRNDDLQKDREMHREGQALLNALSKLTG